MDSFKMGPNHPLFYVSQKPFLSDEHKVDYVQVDEKKTQALQNTKMEWTDVRQSKTWKRIGAFGFKKTNTNNHQQGGHVWRGPKTL